MCIGLVAQSGSSSIPPSLDHYREVLASPLRVVITPSGVFQSEVVVHRLAVFLLAAEITLSCLNRWAGK